MFGNDNIVNDNKPMPCADEDSKDIAYVRKIMEWINSQPEKFDATRVYSAGFSQNSMFSAYIAFCFNDQFKLQGQNLKNTYLKIHKLGCHV